MHILEKINKKIEIIKNCKDEIIVLIDKYEKGNIENPHFVNKVVKNNNLKKLEKIKKELEELEMFENTNDLMLTYEMEVFEDE